MSTEENNNENDHQAYMPKDVNENSPVGNPEPTPTPLASSYGFERRNEDLVWVAGKVNNVRQEMSRYVIGQHEMVELLLTGIFSNGHMLLEGAPGVAKTLSAKVLSKALAIDFSRIQFTPDLMPSDVIGTSVFNMKDSSFTFKRGPIFSNIVLIDAINGARAKTQAALSQN